MATPSPARGAHGHRLLVRLALSTLLGAALVGGAAVPGHADRSQVPDRGERPQPAGEVPLPDGSPARPGEPDPLLDGPLAAEIAEVELEIEEVSAELDALLPEVGPAQSAVDYAEQQWRIAADDLHRAQAHLNRLVDESFRGAAALPSGLYRSELPGLSAHAPLPVAAPLGVDTAARQLVEARETEQAASDLFRSAREAEENLTDLRDELEAELTRLREELDDLRARNLEELAAQEREREAAAQEGAADRYPQTQPVDGHEAHPAALRAVRFALDQLGKPYQWGAEGPDRYDCSGLVWAAYRSVGETLPRVAADQYNGTRGRLVTRSATVAQRGLLPGDLVFFASGSSWQSIHHVGMYVGGGQMVHAPNRNEVVKVSPVWWDRFFGATRVVEAVPVDGDGGDGGDDPDPAPTDPEPTDTPSPTPGPTSTSTTIPIDPPTTDPTGEPSDPETQDPGDPPETDPPETDPPETDPPETDPPESDPPTGSPSPSPTPTSSPAPTATLTSEPPDPEPTAEPTLEPTTSSPEPSGTPTTPPAD